MPNRSNFSNSIIQSRFLSPVFIVFILGILIFSNYLNLGYRDQWVITVVVTIMVFSLNFFLGYHTVRALLLKSVDRSYVYIVAFLFFLSYFVVPLMAAYTVTLFKDFFKDLFLGFNLEFWEIFLTIFGTNLFVNTVLLIFYYSNSSIVVFEKNSGFPSPESDKKTVTETKGDEKNGEESHHSHEDSGSNQPEFGGELDSREHILLKSNRVLTRIRLAEIVYFEVNLNTVLIQTTKRFYETRSTLGEILQGLPGNFIQINKSVVINLNFFEQLAFESDTKRSKAKIAYQREDEEIEESFYIGRKFLPTFKGKLAK